MASEKADNEKMSGGGAGNRREGAGRGRRIAAWIGILLLAGMYLLTFAAALLARPGASTLFRMSLALTIALPIAIWIFRRMADIMGKRE